MYTLSNGISVIVTAYKTQTFITECMLSIHSVFNQCNRPYEILIGVDGCRDTLTALQNTVLPRNSKVFWFENNVGTYVVSNTLLSKKSYNKVMRFDSDDIMKQACLRYLDDTISPPVNTIYRLPCYNFSVKDGRVCFRGIGKSNIPGLHGPVKLPQGPVAVEHAAGVIIYDDNVLNILGGYKPWRCAADTDFTDRARTAGIKIKKLDPRLGAAFYRRRHSGSLTGSPATDGNSALRNEYKLQAKTDHTIYVTAVTENCVQIV